MKKSSRGQNRAFPGALLGCLVALMLAVSLSGCGDHDERPASRPTATPTVRSAPLEVSVQRVTGRLSHAARRSVVTHVGAIVGRWWRTAYLSDGAKNPFPGFTAGASRLARRDADLLSNASFGAHVSGGTALRQRMSLDVFAVKRRARGVTARMHLVYDTTGEAHRRCKVGGTVSLVPQRGKWRIFGYDVTHDCAAVPTGRRRTATTAPTSAPTSAPTTDGSEATR